MGAPEIESFLSHLALQGRVAASTQNQACSALLFLYREVLQQEPGPVNAIRAKTPQRIPVALSKDETACLLAMLTGVHQLAARLLYGSGLRLMELIRLRVKDLDFEQQAIVVRDGKGAKDRITVLPASVIGPLQQHLQRVKQLHQADLDADLGNGGSQRTQQHRQHDE